MLTVSVMHNPHDDQGKRLNTFDQLGLWKLAWPELQTPDNRTSETLADTEANAGWSASGSGSTSSGRSGQPGASSSKLPAAFRFGAASSKVAPEQSAKGNSVQAAGQVGQMPNMPGADAVGSFDWQRLMMAQIQMQMQNSAPGSSWWEDHGNEASQSDSRKPHYQTFEKSILTAVQDGVGTSGDPEGWEQSLEEEHRYRGHIRDFNEGGGFGFLECPSAKAKYGMDVWIHRRQMFGFNVGDEVSFMVSRNHNGQPQARHVIKAADVARIKAKKKDQEHRTELQLREKKVAAPRQAIGKGGVMDEEAAKRFQASLKRKMA